MIHGQGGAFCPGILRIGDPILSPVIAALTTFEVA